ncbi:hypothetical protein CEXT_746231 [Caerostris extrusa]|uniref:Uncharacterized protein n=1 Tax=Caerostris extrusa TaxID=172846 RepID=A0AAV4T003_CAEEX|nr:hypothetical protein CEXT_746231 [Caerostris extrusa]
MYEIQKLKHQIKEVEKDFTDDGMHIKIIKTCPRIHETITRHDCKQKRFNESVLRNLNILSIVSKINSLLDELALHLNELKKHGSSCAQYRNFLLDTHSSLSRLMKGFLKEDIDDDSHLWI